MRSPRLGRVVRLCGIATCVVGLACGSSSGDGGSDVELQVGNGIANDIDRQLMVRVTTSRETERRPLALGDSSLRENMTLFHLPLNDGDLVEIALENSSGVQVAHGTCTVAGARDLSYARAHIAVIQFWFGQYLHCEDGLQ